MKYVTLYAIYFIFIEIYYLYLFCTLFFYVPYYLHIIYIFIYCLCKIAALLDKYGQVIPPKQIKHGVWCIVDGTNFVKCFIVLRKMELMKHREQELINAESYKKTQHSMGCNSDLFPKSLGR